MGTHQNGSPVRGVLGSYVAAPRERAGYPPEVGHRRSALFSSLLGAPSGPLRRPGPHGRAVLGRWAVIIPPTCGPSTRKAASIAATREAQSTEKRTPHLKGLPSSGSGVRIRQAPDPEISTRWSRGRPGLLCPSHRRGAALAQLACRGSRPHCAHVSDWKILLSAPESRRDNSRHAVHGIWED